MQLKPLGTDFDQRITGLMLLLLFSLLLSWWSGLKSLVFDQSQVADNSQTQRPNILMIVVDDLGYNDTSAINPNGIPTPTIQALAEQGAVFTRHYADSTCSPSRVAIMSGRFPQRSGFRPVGTGIPDDFPTLGEKLRDAGYTTYLTGKWHAGEDREAMWPHNKGFEQWFGFLTQFDLSPEPEDGIKRPRKPTYHNPLLRTNSEAPEQHPGHLTDILTQHTLTKLETFQATDKPWFIYHAFLAPHNPIQPAARYAEKFPDTPEGKYRALVTQLDDAIAQLLAAVDRSNTLVVFVSDNGGTNNALDNNFPFFGAKNQPLEGAYRTPLIMNWPDIIPEGTVIDDIAMNVDIYPTLLAIAQATPEVDADGINLWNAMVNKTPIPPRQRGWEGFHANINTISYSFLSPTGEFRLARRQGVSTELFDLLSFPAGDVDVLPQQTETGAQLERIFWQEHWSNSLLAVRAQRTNLPGETQYLGFDAMRTPNRYSFSIGLEIGPLEPGVLPATEPSILAGQEAIWKLVHVPNHGLEWHIGGAILNDASFEPSRCNRIVLTGHYQPFAHLAKRDPESILKFFSEGALRDIEKNIEPPELSDEEISRPTFVRHAGTARFTNTMLSSYSEDYCARVDSDFSVLCEALYKEQRLSIAHVEMMDSQLCQDNVVR